MSISEQLDKASAQLKGLSEKASAAEANANAAKAKDKADLEQRVDAAEATAKQASDDMKASAKDTKDEAKAGSAAGPDRSDPAIRWDLVDRVRREIAAGDYDTPEKWQIALDRLLDRLEED